MAKAVKNETEQQMMIEAHRRDGAALTKWIYWLKQAVKTESLTGNFRRRRLETFREAQPDYQGPSFAPILSYAEHGAIVHYSQRRNERRSRTPRLFAGGYRRTLFAGHHGRYPHHRAGLR